MNPTLVLKFAFTFAPIVYAIVAYAIGHDPANRVALPDGMQMLPGIFALTFAVQAVIGPFMASQIKGDPQHPGVRQAKFIIRAAFFEAGAIYGLVLSLMTKDPSYSVYFGLPAVLLLLLTPV